MNMRKEKTKAKSALFTFLYARAEPGKMFKIWAHNDYSITRLVRGCQSITS
jgi:hypothetical protein